MPVRPPESFPDAPKAVPLRFATKRILRNVTSVYDSDFRCLDRSDGNFNTVGVDRTSLHDGNVVPLVVTF